MEAERTNGPPRAFRSGSLSIYVGAMFAGKTAAMLEAVQRFVLAGISACVVKHAADSRYCEGEAVITHGGARRASSPPRARRGGVRVVVAGALGGVALDASELVVGIDEGQFFPDLVEVVERWVDGGRAVVVAALDGTFERRPFGRVLELIPLADSVVKLRAVCRLCQDPQAPAIFSLRLGPDRREVVIGGAEAYAAACRACWVAAQRPGFAVVAPQPSGSSSAEAIAPPSGPGDLP